MRTASRGEDDRLLPQYHRYVIDILIDPEEFREAEQYCRRQLKLAEPLAANGKLRYGDFGWYHLYQARILPELNIDVHKEELLSLLHDAKKHMEHDPPGRVSILEEVDQRIESL